MRKNEGNLDRIIRVIIGLVALILGTYSFDGTLKVIAIIVGLVMLLTGFSGFCGLYTLLKINTCKRK